MRSRIVLGAVAAGLLIAAAVPAAASARVHRRVPCFYVVSDGPAWVQALALKRLHVQTNGCHREYFAHAAQPYDVVSWANGDLCYSTWNLKWTKSGTGAKPWYVQGFGIPFCDHTADIISLSWLTDNQLGFVLKSDNSTPPLPRGTDVYTESDAWLAAGRHYLYVEASFYEYGASASAFPDTCSAPSGVKGAIICGEKHWFTLS